MYGVATKEKKDTYRIDWDHTELKQIMCYSEKVMEGMHTYLSHPYLSSKKPSVFEFDPITPAVLKHQKLYDFPEYDEESDTCGDTSDKELDDVDLEEVDDIACLGINFKRIADINYDSTNTIEDSSSNETFEGLLWKSSTELSKPSYRLEGKEGKLKDNLAPLFDTPLSSMFAFMPPLWFKKIVFESNMYAKSHFGSTDGKVFVLGTVFEPISLTEIMVFHGILIFMTLYYMPGASYSSYWDEPSTQFFTRKMTWKRFQQIRSVLSFNNSTNESQLERKDSLIKIRPLLNMLKISIAYYLEPGSDFALDEASFASRSSYGRDLIFFNPQKPGGKFHYRAYCVCDNSTLALLRYRFATKNNSD